MLFRSWSKMFLILFLIGFVFYRNRISKNTYIYFSLTLLIYLSIKFQIVHSLFNFIYFGYDFDALPLNGSQPYF